jgi:prepilin-type N-terminal cleavage/methylation domain-containing protein
MNRCAARTRRFATSGFTLIEVMVVVAIVAILSAIAVPAYRDYIVRGQLADARNLMSGTAAQLEQFYQDNRSYANAAGVCGVVMPGNSRFTFTCALTGVAPVPANQGFTVTATGVGTTAGFVFTIDQRRRQATTSLPAGWGAYPATCWVAKKGETC